MFAGIQGAGSTSPHPQGGGQESTSLRNQGDQSYQLHSQCRGPGWLKDLPNVTQLKSNKTQLAGMHSMGNPPPVHTHTQEPLFSA